MTAGRKWGVVSQPHLCLTTLYGVSLVTRPLSIHVSLSHSLLKRPCTSCQLPCRLWMPFSSRQMPMAVTSHQTLTSAGARANDPMRQTLGLPKPAHETGLRNDRAPDHRALKRSQPGLQTRLLEFLTSRWNTFEQKKKKKVSRLLKALSPNCSQNRQEKSPEVSKTKQLGRYLKSNEAIWPPCVS